MAAIDRNRSSGSSFEGINPRRTIEWEQEAGATGAGKSVRQPGVDLAMGRARDHPRRKRVPDVIAELPLIGDEVGIVAMHEFIAIVPGRLFGLLGHGTSPSSGPQLFPSSGPQLFLT